MKKKQKTKKRNRIKRNPFFSLKEVDKDFFLKKKKKRRGRWKGEA
jgi:hypothetical protein